jgi:bifunctional DNA-binding transcriptional regulator/antitoxin component of YhaV-PrlF toxin-antitoxin module
MGGFYMGENTKKIIISGKIDNLGRLLLTPTQMEQLNFVEGATAELDFNDEGIIISKSLGYSIVYDRLKIMPNGILIGQDICRSKLLMTDERKTVESERTKICVDGDRSQDNVVDTVYYNVDYRIDNDRIVIPLTQKQQQANLQVVRTVDELGRIIVPAYLGRIYDLAMITGIEINGDKIVISNSFNRKVKINELGMITIPQDILRSLKIAPMTEMKIEASKYLTLSKV